jgi:hypothetical protein
MRITFVVLVCFSASASAQQARITDVAWMQGCWEMTVGDRVVEEHWTVPRAGTMLGVGRTTRGASLIEHEFVVLREEGDHLTYEAHPSGQSPAVFVSQTRKAGSAETPVVFENLMHDFPQRVGYQQKGADGLLAWVEGSRNGQVRRMEFPYQRVACTTNK